MTQPWPTGPLPVSVDIAPGASPAGTIDSWDSYWVDITNDTRERPKIVIEEGIPDEATQADPGTCALTINNGYSKVTSTLNQLGCYSPRNPRGPYSGKLAKNTPLRIRMLRGKDSWARTRATGTGFGTSETGIVWTNTTNMGTDGTRAIIINNSGQSTATGAGAWDFDLTTGIAVDVLPGLGNYTVFQIKFRRFDVSNNYILRMDFQPDNTMAIYLQRVLGGVTTTIASVSNPASVGTLTANTVYNVRLKADGGFIGGKVWLGSTQPASWNVSSSAEGAYTMDNTVLTTDIRIEVGKVGTPATTQAYYYPITINTYPFIGTVPEWPVRWDKSGNDSTVPIKAAGVLRRLQAGKTPLKSPLYSFIDATKPAALWTLEDDSNSTLASSQTPGVAGATLFNTTPGGWTSKPSFGGTSSQYTVEVDTTISGVLPFISPNGSWFAWFTFYMPVLPVTNPTIFRVRASGTVSQWDLKISDSFGGVMYLVGQASDGTVLVNQSITYVPGQWTTGQIEIQQTGSTFTGRVVNYQYGTGAVNGATSSAVTGNIGAPQAWSIYGQTGFQASAAGPVAFWNIIPTINIPNLMLAGNGFVGEDAGTRIARLAAERGVKVDLISGGQTSLLGVQSADKLTDVWKEASDTDIGLLTEFHGGIRYRTRGRRYAQNPIMTLDFSAGHIAEPPEPTDDDQRLRNDITVNRKNGAQGVRAYDSVSIAVNDVIDTSYEINPMSDDELRSQASFRLYLATWNEMRWPSIIIDLRRNAGVSQFIDRAVSLSPGSRITVANPPTNIPVGTLSLLVEGIKQTMEQFYWRMELVCSPYGPWDIPDFRTTAGTNLVDLAGSTLGSNEAATAVGFSDTWTITNSGRDWRSTNVPFNWKVKNEIVTVTAITGTGTQTATVTRGVSGFTETHSIGESINLATPLYIAM